MTVAKIRWSNVSSFVNILATVEYVLSGVNVCCKGSRRSFRSSKGPERLNTWVVDDSFNPLTQGISFLPKV